MLTYHLDSAVDAASRNYDFISCSAEWIVPRFELAPGVCVVDWGRALRLRSAEWCATELQGRYAHFNRFLVQLTLTIG